MFVIDNVYLKNAEKIKAVLSSDDGAAFGEMLRNKSLKLMRPDKFIMKVDGLNFGLLMSIYDFRALNCFKALDEILKERRSIFLSRFCAYEAERGSIRLNMVKSIIETAHKHQDALEWLVVGRDIGWKFDSVIPGEEHLWEKDFGGQPSCGNGMLLFVKAGYISAEDALTVLRKDKDRAPGHNFVGWSGITSDEDKMAIERMALAGTVSIDADMARVIRSGAL